MKRAVIDIGSNSIRLLVEGNLNKYINTTQLAEGLAIDNRLKPDAIERTVLAIVDFYNMANLQGAEERYVFATEAIRSANNGQNLVSILRDKHNIQVDVLSPEKEALAGYLGAKIGNGRDCVIDIGGASTEIIVGQGEKIIYSKSLPIGIVKLRDVFNNNLAKLQSYISKTIKKYDKIGPVDNAIAIGGSASTIVAVLQEGFDRAKVHHYYLTRKEINIVLQKIIKAKDPKDVKGLPIMRSNVIIGGIVLLDTILDYIGKDGVIVSENDNMEGYLRLLDNNHKN